MITIEKGVPVPPYRRAFSKTADLMEAMQAMQVGDSISMNVNQGTVAGCAKRLGIHYTTRSTYGPDGKKAGVRVWRLESPSKGSLGRRSR
jgi:hypothetical protein